jgi:hypothetical protein
LGRLWVSANSAAICFSVIVAWDAESLGPACVSNGITISFNEFGWGHLPHGLDSGKSPLLASGLRHV